MGAGGDMSAEAGKPHGQDGRGTVVGRRYDTGETFKFCWENGVWTSMETAKGSVTSWLAPALFDGQINGYAGVDFQQENLQGSQLEAAAKAIWRDGCTGFLLTLITREWPRLLQHFRHVKRLRDESPFLRAFIPGWHIEGPFLSTQPGFHGAHDPKWMLDPGPDHLRALLETAGSDKLLLTVSPERPGSIAFIEAARKAGVQISLGHTNADAAILRGATRAGASGFTHLANGCPRELDRHDNILFRVLDQQSLTVSLIPDVIHVSPPLFRLIHRLQPADRIIYVSDAMAAAGMPPGRYRLGKLELEVGPDQVVRQPGKPLFAGSALRPVAGVLRAASMLRVSWREVWDRFSTLPSSLMGLKASLCEGGKANFCLIQEEEGRPVRMQTFFEGIPGEELTLADLA